MKYKELSDKSDKLMKHLIGQLPISGSKHIIWDLFISEVAKLRPYLDYILEKENLMQSSRKRLTTVKERLKKNPIEIANNAIVFKSANRRWIEISYRISNITWENKVVSKQRDLDTVEGRIDIVTHQVKLFMDMFDPLLKKALPFFWEEKGSMLSEK